MEFSRCLAIAFLVATVFPAQMISQQTSAPQPTTVPRLVNFSGRATDKRQQPIPGMAGITFSIYKDQHEGAALWIETQSVAIDQAGNFTAQLGATKTGGMPLDLFASGEARWLGVRVDGGQEQPRILLLSVPYALKAADAETVGGLPASAFVLATEVRGSSAQAQPSQTPVGNSDTVAPPPASNVTTSGGTAHALPLWTTGTNIQSSSIAQTGTGATARIGIGTTAPAAVLDVKGTEIVRGMLSLAATGTAAAAAGKNSQQLDFTASAFNSASSTAVPQNFRWVAEAVGNNTAGATGTLNLLFGQGSTIPAETGLHINNKGVITFAAGQKFPSAVSSVGLSAPAADFTVTGSPVKTAGTISLNWVTPPTSANTANAIVRRDANGDFAGHVLSVNAVNADSYGSTFGYGLSGRGSIYGVSGYSITDGGVGVLGAVTGGGYGVHGVGGNQNVGSGVVGDGYGTTPYGIFGPDGVDGVSHDISGSGVAGFNSFGGTGVYGFSAGGWSGNFYGDVNVGGNLSKAGGSFKIDHPLEPASKYLYHSFVESPDMKNIYDGNVTTDAEGNAVVQLPKWFEALNRDFRYQLTVLGQFAQAIVAVKIANHQFTIKTDKPNVEVSWQVTGIRQDAWANAHRIPVEVQKPKDEQGFYLHPELFGAPAESAIGARRHPLVQKTLKEQAAKLAASSKP